MAGTEGLILNCNKLAMEHLRADNYQAALGLLNKAADLLNSPDLPVKLKAITLNNLGCYYKRTGKLTIALQYLHKALDLEVSSPADRTNLAGTHLNVCAIHSTLGRHDVAVRHAYQALELLIDAEATSNNAATLAIAYHNAGVEEEHLKNYERASELYITGWKASSKQLGQSHALTVSLKESYQALNEAKAKVSGVKSGKDMKLPTLPKRKASLSKTVDATYRKQNSRSVVNTRDSTPNRILTPLEPVKSAPGTSHPTRHKRTSSSGRPPRSYRFKKHEPEEPEVKPHAKKLPTLSLWKNLQDAAVTIQRHWRGYFTRKHLKSLVSLHTKGNRRKEAERMAKEALAELELLKQEALSGMLMKNIQNIVKQGKRPAIAGKISGYPRPSSRSFQPPLSPIPESIGEERKERLKRVQAQIRGVLERKSFNRKESAATVIQKHMRGRSVRLLYSKVYEAICVIQQYWRLSRVN